MPSVNRKVKITTWALHTDISVWKCVHVRVQEMWREKKGYIQNRSADCTVPGKTLVRKLILETFLSVQSKGEKRMQQRRLKCLKIAWYFAREWSSACKCGKMRRKGKTAYFRFIASIPHKRNRLLQPELERDLSGKVICKWQFEKVACMPLA